VLLLRDKGDCEGALRALDQYERAAGPALPQGSPAPRLIRECQEQVEQGRAAAEAARQMKAEGDKKAAQDAKKADITPVPPSKPAPRTRP
jgi:hypothetical protein